MTDAAAGAAVPRPEVAPFVARPPGSLEEATNAADAAAAHWGLGRPQLLRIGSNAIFAAGEEVILRVFHPSAPADQAIWLAGEMTRRGVRVPHVMRDAPFDVGDLSVVAVQRIAEQGSVDWAEVGEMVARVHTIEPVEVAGRYPLPWCASFPWWDFDTLLARTASLIDGHARTALRAAVERHLPVLRAARAGGVSVVCHGDIHPGNVLATAEGMVLLDWDLLCRGPIGWDHGPLMTWTQRWGGRPGIYEEFAAGYGRSLRGQPVAEAIAELRLVAATLMRVLAEEGNTESESEAARRLRWWRGEPDAPQWRAQ